jgi:hypothetical protein
MTMHSLVDSIALGRDDLERFLLSNGNYLPSRGLCISPSWNYNGHSIVDGYLVAASVGVRKDTKLESVYMIISTHETNWK